MSYLYWYFGIGVIVLLTVYISHRLTVKKDDPDLHAILESFNPDRDKWHYKLREKVLLPLFIAILGPLAWPVFLYWKAKEFFSKENTVETLVEEDQDLKVTRADLIDSHTVDEIEARESVTDPLGAVSALPFGHLNSAWNTFKSKAQATDELWTFKVIWEQRWRNKQKCRGYALLRGDEVIAHWMTGWEIIEPPPEPPKPIPTAEEIEKKLTSKDWNQRWSAIAEIGDNYMLNDKQIERALRDKERLVRFAIAKRYDLPLTEKHIEMGLTDKDASIREVFSYRHTYKLTPAQLERGLTDKNSMNRLRILHRDECVLTPAQFERGLTDEDDILRSVYASNEDNAPTHLQIERGLTDADDEVRLSFAKRKDITLTDAQIQRGLSDPSDEVRNHFALLHSSLVKE
jgi:hypothetical protein